MHVAPKSCPAHTSRRLESLQGSQAALGGSPPIPGSQKILANPSAAEAGFGSCSLIIHAMPGTKLRAVHVPPEAGAESSSIVEIGKLRLRFVT